MTGTVTDLNTTS